MQYKVILSSVPVDLIHSTTSQKKKPIYLIPHWLSIEHLQHLTVSQEDPGITQGNLLIFKITFENLLA